MQLSSGIVPPAPAPAGRASDALVFLGATGDLAYQQIFPALQQMVIHGELKVPVIATTGTLSTPIA